MKFTKPALSLDAQLDRLARRGMDLGDRQSARHYLQHLNYYRLGAYWLPFEADHARHSFRPGSRFADVISLYVFDRELRLLVLDAIERVEVSVRTQWAYHMAHAYGPHCLLQAGLFRPDGRRRHYPELVGQLQRDVRASQETFIRHLLAKYEEPLPPIWAAVEVMSFGQLSKWYAITRHRADRNRVARAYDMDETNLVSFLHHLATVRNVAAHHARLWNREFTVTFKLPRRRPAALIPSLNPGDGRRIYNSLAMLLYLLDIVSPGHHWRERFQGLLDGHGIDTDAMGFPRDWKARPLWAGPIT